MTPRVEEILSWYGARNPGVRANLYRLLMAGKCSDSGKLVILPVDQGVEHGPGRSFSANPLGYDPRYHPHLAVNAGCSGYAAPLGQLQAAAEYSGQIPFILKANGHTRMMPDGDSWFPALTATVKDALELGCCAIGFTVYNGSAYERTMYEQLRELIAEAHAVGLPVVVWAYPRGPGITKGLEDTADVVAYAAHLACQLGADIVKTKPPSKAGIGLEENRKVYEAAMASGVLKLDTLEQRIAHVVQAMFGGMRILIHSGGEARNDNEIFAEQKAIARGGALGTIIGRNSFQRPEDAATSFLNQIIQIHLDYNPV